MSEQRIEYVAYIKAPIEQVWEALTDPEITEKYWGGTRIESDWKQGSKVRYVRDGAVTDEHEILEVAKPTRLVHTFNPLFGDFKGERPSRVELELTSGGSVTRLELLHDGFEAESRVFAACRGAWPVILCGLKTLVETGDVLPEFDE